MAANSGPTVRELASTLGAVENQLKEMADSLDQLEQSRKVEVERTWTALGSLAGIEGVARGMAHVAALLGPLRQLVPPTTATDLAQGVSTALMEVRAALGGNRQTNFGQLQTDWDGPVRYIGRVDEVDMAREAGLHVHEEEAS